MVNTYSYIVILQYKNRKTEATKDRTKKINRDKWDFESNVILKKEILEFKHEINQKLLTTVLQKESFPSENKLKPNYYYIYDYS